MIGPDPQPTTPTRKEETMHPVNHTTTDPRPITPPPTYDQRMFAMKDVAAQIAPQDLYHLVRALEERFKIKVSVIDRTEIGELFINLGEDLTDERWEAFRSTAAWEDWSVDTWVLWKEAHGYEAARSVLEPPVDLEVTVGANVWWTSPNGGPAGAGRVVETGIVEVDGLALEGDELPCVKVRTHDDSQTWAIPVSWITSASQSHWPAPDPASSPLVYDPTGPIPFPK